jgi:hypothetical protein
LAGGGQEALAGLLPSSFYHFTFLIPFICKTNSLLLFRKKNFCFLSSSVEAQASQNGCIFF